MTEHCLFNCRGGRNAVRWQRGFTIAEALITLAIFSTVLTLAGEIAQAAFSSTSRETEQAVITREATVALDKITRELRQCRKILYPEVPVKSVLELHSGWHYGYKLVSSGSRDLLVAFLMNGSDGKSSAVIGYRYCGSTHCLERCTYNSSNSSVLKGNLDKAKPVQVTTLARNVSSFSFWSCPPEGCYGQYCLGVNLVVAGDRALARSGSGQFSGIPLSSEVKVRGVE